MNSQLTQIAAQQHIDDLHRSAQRERRALPLREDARTLRGYRRLARGWRRRQAHAVARAS